MPIASKKDEQSENNVKKINSRPVLRLASRDGVQIPDEADSEAAERREYVAERMAHERNRRMRVAAASDEQMAATEASSGVKKVTLLSYAPMLLVAVLKDLLDLTGIGSLPGIGTVITFCFSILIFFLALMSGSFRGKMKYKKGMILIVGTLVEAIGFGLNFLPLETLTVTAMYLVDKAEEKGGMIGRAAGKIKRY